MGVINRHNAPHYGWGDGCDGWHLTNSADVSVIEERMPPGTAEMRHRHSRARQMFYVLSGALTMELEGTTHVLSAGDALFIPPGEAHQAQNVSGDDVRFLVMSTPRAKGDREPA